MDDLAAAARVLAGMGDAVDEAFTELRGRLPADTNPRGPLGEFDPLGNDWIAANAYVQVAATRRDGRYVGWIVEVSVWESSAGDWTANVKAEIDLEDRHGEDWCVLNEQELVAEATALPSAIARAARLVTDYPRDDLLTPGWEPPDFGADDD